MILSEALFGAGNTVFVAIAQFVLVFLILIPLAWLLSIKAGLGLIGMWIAAAVYAVMAASTMTTQFARGKWKNIAL